MRRIKRIMYVFLQNPGAFSAPYNTPVACYSSQKGIHTSYMSGGVSIQGDMNSGEIHNYLKLLDYFELQFMEELKSPEIKNFFYQTREATKLQLYNRCQNKCKITERFLYKV